MARRKSVWCVKDNDGRWHAARGQKYRPVTVKAMLCGRCVFPWNAVKRRPTCPICRERLMRGEDKAAARAAGGKL